MWKMSNAHIILIEIFKRKRPLGGYIICNIYIYIYNIKIDGKEIGYDFTCSADCSEYNNEVSGFVKGGD